MTFTESAIEQGTTDWKETLRVSSGNIRHDKQGNLANKRTSQSRKPLGSDTCMPASLRDMLLPKLMRGEVRVKDAKTV